MASSGFTQVVTDNGANYRAKDFTRTVEALASRHQRIRAYTPRHNGKVERFNRLLVDEVLYVRSYALRSGCCHTKKKNEKYLFL